MTVAAVEVRRLVPVLVFDLEDRYARDRAVRGPHPRPVGTVRLRLVGQVVLGVRHDFPVPFELYTPANASGYRLFFGEERLAGGSRGSRRRLDLAAGTYVVRVESDFYQTAEREDVALPMAGPTLFDLEPGYAYPFPTESTLGHGRGPTLLRGSLHQRDGRGVADALVDVPGQSNLCRTDATGQWVLVFPDTQPDGDVTVRVRFPGGAVMNVPGVRVTPGRASSLFETALRGWVLGKGGVPAAGARVRVSGDPAAAATAADGGWAYYFGPNQAAALVDVTAELPDGTALTQPGVQVQPRSTVVVPTFRFP